MVHAARVQLLCALHARIVNTACPHRAHCTHAQCELRAQLATLGDRPVLHLFTCCSQGSRELLKTAMQPAKCTCHALRRLFTSLFPAGQQHLVCRTSDQWSTLLPEHVLAVFLQDARKVTLPTHGFVEKSTERLHEQFQRSTESVNIFPVLLKSIIQDLILQDNARYISKYPWVNPTVVKQCQKTLHKPRLSASVWDKNRADLSAMCSGLQLILELDVNKGKYGCLR